MQDRNLIGLTGEVTLRTRGSIGPGEIILKVQGGTEEFIAWSEEPIEAGTTALVITDRGEGAVEIIPWTNPFGPTF